MPGVQAGQPGAAAGQPGAALPSGGLGGSLGAQTVQPGVGRQAEQAGVQRPGQVQPGVTTPVKPGPVPGADYVVPPNFRAVPQPQQAVPAINWQELHVPGPVVPVAPIAPPPRTLRLGDFTSAVPDDVPDNVLTPVNEAAANTEAAIATGFNSIGINPSRSDRIAAGTIAGVAAGAVGGAIAAGVPMAIAGAVPGGIVGAAVGAGIGSALGAAGVAVAPWTAPIDVVGGPIGGGLIGAGVGAAAGAAALGIPAAVVGGVAGGIAGGAVGGFLGAAF
ncbi:hypothetical protein LTV02_33295 [Nocardia yamanashiensis]|uniref:hypothetical protein n=1 Tax=Nocardia yamanashiensis TaxID=209247 RepID=UPI001E318ABA|nr:hypothetical protein [Nocardia yamanashiensis]UGT46058.1 hypothetical protein LTV02_33295 [Nocardia yamanashiensis]